MTHKPFLGSAVDTIARSLHDALRQEQAVYIREIESDVDDDDGGHTAVRRLNKRLARALAFVRRVVGAGRLCVLSPIALESADHVLVVIPDDLADRLRHTTGAVIIPIAKTAIVKAAR